MPECVFCKIAAGKVPSETLYEDDRVRAFRDIHPKAPVHVLVIPKNHIASVADLGDRDAGITAALMFSAKRVAETLGLRGYKLVFNVGREGGQVIDHLHLHLLGGWKSKTDDMLANV